jgi:uncharacterized protein (TIGR03083 family)
MTITDDLQPRVAAEYLALADALQPLPESAWETTSLCEGWRIREVIAHVTMAVRYSDDEFMAELQRCEFDFTRLSNEIAHRDAQLPTGTLIANLRSDTMHRWTPPGGGAIGALSHVVIHALDATKPLGLPRTTTDDTIRIILDSLTGDGGHAHFGTDITGRTLQATDLGWSYGSGPTLAATSSELVIALCGRILTDPGTRSV